MEGARRKVKAVFNDVFSKSRITVFRKYSVLKKAEHKRPNTCNIKIRYKAIFPSSNTADSMKWLRGVCWVLSLDKFSVSSMLWMIQNKFLVYDMMYKKACFCFKSLPVTNSFPWSSAAAESGCFMFGISRTVQCWCIELISKICNLWLLKSA